MLWLLALFAGVDPPGGLTASNAPWTDEGFNLANARERVLSGQFATGDIDRSLTNGAYSALAAAMFAVTGPSLAAGRACPWSRPLERRWGSGWSPRYARPARRRRPRRGQPHARARPARPGRGDGGGAATGAFVLATWAAWRPSPAAGAGVGLLVAAAVSAKAIALLPGLVMLADAGRGLPSAGERPALVMGLAGLATLAVAGGGLAGRGGPSQLGPVPTSLRIWPTVQYLDGRPPSPAASAAT